VLFTNFSLEERIREKLRNGEDEGQIQEKEVIMKIFKQNWKSLKDGEDNKYIIFVFNLC